MLKLTAKTDNETLILKYLELNASLELKAKINNGTKTLEDCWKFITEQAKKLAKNNCACIEDSKVYGWAIHFFEEDGIKAVKTEKIEAPKAEKKKPKEENTQMSLFDMMG